MTIKPTIEDYTAFADHNMAHLPDSISARRVILQCLLANLPKGHPRLHEVAIIYAHLTAHERAQQEFIFNGGAK